MRTPDAGAQQAAESEALKVAKERVHRYVLPAIKRLKTLIGEELEKRDPDIAPEEFEMAVRFVLAGLIVAGHHVEESLPQILDREVAAYVHALHTEWANQVGPPSGISVVSMRVKKVSNGESEGLAS